EAGGLQVGDRLVALNNLHDVLRGQSKTEQLNLHDWLMVRGNVSNTAQAFGSPPLLDKQLWHRAMLNGANSATKDDEHPEVISEKYVKEAIQATEKLGHPVLPGFFPIATQGLMVYRSYGYVNAVALKELRGALGEHYKPGEIVWSSIQLDGGLPNLLDSRTGANPKRDKVEGWLRNYASVPGFISLVYENSTIGTLSCDHKCVYAIDDLAVPPVF